MLSANEVRSISKRNILPEYTAEDFVTDNLLIAAERGEFSTSFEISSNVNTPDFYIEDAWHTIIKIKSELKAQGFVVIVERMREKDYSNSYIYGARIHVSWSEIDS